MRSCLFIVDTTLGLFASVGDILLLLDSVSHLCDVFELRGASFHVLLLFLGIGMLLDNIVSNVPKIISIYVALQNLSIR